MTKLSMSNVRSMRRMVLAGYSVKQLSHLYGVSESAIRSYTKSERSQLK